VAERCSETLVSLFSTYKTASMDLLIGDLFRNAARAVPDRDAATLGEESLTFREIDRRANGVAGALRRMDVSRGDRVVVWSATSLDLVPLFAGLAKLGAVFVPLNPALGSDEAAAIVSMAQPAMILTDVWRAAAGHALAAALGVSFSPLVTGAGEEAEPAVRELDERDPHVVFFTSGSTGTPKGVVLSHRVNVLRTHPGALLEPRGAMVCPYPMFHMAAWTIALQQWQARDRVVFCASAAPAICSAVERHRASGLNCIPALWHRVLDHLAPGATLPSLRFADTGTSATPVALLEAIAAACPNAQVRVFYGSTEAGSVAALEHADIRRKPGSVGVPAPSTEVRVDDRGELWVRGPLLFDGYFADAQATGAALVSGWYRTGDLAEVDADGYLTIVGRAGDLIRTGGEGVVPVEVEAILATHPRIADVAVVGIPDERWGEVVCAVIVPSGSSVTVEELRAYCDGRLAPFKHPRRVVVVDAIPRKSATNQIQRRLLVEALGG
jgi:acyl-CoA synthetase (AMP-forming)/AMP-acid ligase II